MKKYQRCFKSFSDGTPIGGDDLKGTKRRRLTITVSLQKDSGSYRIHIQKSSNFETCL